MKIINLTENSKTYTSNVYLVSGTYNKLDDVNALVDVGRDLSILEMVLEAATGVGKKRLDAVVLTHSHFDHSAMLSHIITVFKPVVYAYSNAMTGIDKILKNGEMIKLGDRNFEVIYMPGHSSDSICLHCRIDGVLFSGDSPILVHSTNGNYEEGFISAMERICRLDVRTIYFGHGKPLHDNCNEKLRKSLSNIRTAMNLKVL